MKAYCKNGKRDIQRAGTEIEILKKLKHPNIVKIVDAYELGSPLNPSIVIIMELIEGIELYEFIRGNGGLEEPMAIHIFSQIVKGISACHALNIVHRDLKAENILVDVDGRVCIVDFELANYERREGLSTFCGSWFYMSPEMCEGKRYSGKGVDIWCLGVLLYLLIQGEYPFNDENDSRLLKKIVACKYKLPSAEKAAIPNLISKLLLKDPRERLTTPEIREHAMFYNESLENIYFTDKPSTSHYSTSRHPIPMVPKCGVPRNTNIVVPVVSKPKSLIRTAKSDSGHFNLPKNNRRKTSSRHTTDPSQPSHRWRKINKFLIGNSRFRNTSSYEDLRIRKTKSNDGARIIRSHSNEAIQSIKIDMRKKPQPLRVSTSSTPPPRMRLVRRGRVGDRKSGKRGGGGVARLLPPLSELRIGVTLVTPNERTSCLTRSASPLQGSRHGVSPPKLNLLRADAGVPRVKSDPVWRNNERKVGRTRSSGQLRKVFLQGDTKLHRD